ncbi:MAG TPA: redoxin domain-containing protein [Bryobacteraceae bacterium]|nr:redoxin domain-containing protein [Bryobacteraceae bacterium]
MKERKVMCTENDKTLRILTKGREEERALKPALREEDARSPREPGLRVGQRAPAFELPAVVGAERRMVRLADYLGKKHLVITFHPLDWTPTCESQVPILNSMRAKFAERDAELIDISVDSVESHEAWQKNEIGSMGFPLCSDFFPHGEVTEKFGVLRERAPVPGISERAAFIVDKEGVVRFAKVYPIDQSPDLAGLLAEVEKIRGQ